MISCNEYDYIEIACMYHYPVRLTMKSGSVLEGIAIDTQRNRAREECIKIRVDNVEQLVVLGGLKKLQALIDNPHFDEVFFGKD